MRLATSPEKPERFSSLNPKARRGARGPWAPLHSHEMIHLAYETNKKESIGHQVNGLRWQIEGTFNEDFRTQLLKNPRYDLTKVPLTGHVGSAWDGENGYTRAGCM